MFCPQVVTIKVFENDGNPQLMLKGRIVKVLRENPPLVKGDPWVFTVLTEQDMNR